MPTNYERYFGTLEATAKSIVKTCNAARSCLSCPFYDMDERECPIGGDYDCAVGWLEREVDDAD